VDMVRHAAYFQQDSTLTPDDPELCLSSFSKQPALGKRFLIGREKSFLRRNGFFGFFDN